MRKEREEPASTVFLIGNCSVHFFLLLLYITAHSRPSAHQPRTAHQRAQTTMMSATAGDTGTTVRPSLFCAQILKPRALW